MAYHYFKAVPRPECSCLAVGSELHFKKYFGIGTFPLKSPDKIYKDEIISSLEECEMHCSIKDENVEPDTVCLYMTSKSGSSCYVQDGITKEQIIESVKAGWANGMSLFDVIDETVEKEEKEKNRGLVTKKQEKHLRPKETHSAYFYIFVRPVQIILILMAVGYVLSLAYRREMRQRQLREEQEIEQMMSPSDDVFDEEE
ncbi:MAG: hypothetical protein K6F94_08220 [Bacteroidaceae bacterium]|nr:hypothetical protein [Bacteroidaceae bacterium]